jgi:glutamine synthetase
VDTLQDLRTEMVLTMENLGITVECQHHEVATGGQCEIDMKFSPIVSMADQLMLYKYVIKNVAKRNGLSVTFMPKPIFEDNGSGMHCHQSIWKDGKPLFAGDGYAGLSELGLHYIGGILKHAKAINAFTNASTNSYRRLVPGYEAPVLLAYSARNRSASVRIPYGASPKAKRLEVRFPDCTGNPYLAYTAMLMAGLDGIENKIHPGDPMDKDLYDLPPEELEGIPTVAASLEEALNALEADTDFLTKGDVFTEDQLSAYIELKREELEAVKLTPHPAEFDLYYSV